MAELPACERCQPSSSDCLSSHCRLPATLSIRISAHRRIGPALRRPPVRHAARAGGDAAGVARRSGSTRSCRALMRTRGIDFWVVPMREYNEDPVFSSITAPETFCARGAGRSTSSSTSARPPARRRQRPCVERIALGGTSQGGVFQTRSVDESRSRRRPARRQAELWGDEQWLLLKQVVEERKPKVIGDRPLEDVRVQRRSVERRAAGHERSARRRRGRRSSSDAERLPLELIASRLPGRGSVLREDDRARLADDARRCSRTRSSCPARRARAIWCGGGVSAPTIRASAPGSSRACTFSARA